MFRKYYAMQSLIQDELRSEYIKKTNSDILSKVFLSPEGRQYITLCYLAIKFYNSNQIIK